MRKILSQEGRQRLENIRIVKPQFAEQIELQLIQLFQSGKLRGATPLPDKEFKKILEKVLWEREASCFSQSRMV